MPYLQPILQFLHFLRLANEKKKLFLFTLLFIIILFASPIPPVGSDGAYNIISRTIYCKTELACVHEIGHKLDQEAGWQSRKYEFSLAVEVFIWHEIAENNPPHPFVYKIMKFDGLFEWNGWFTNHQAELYASLFEWSGGVSEKMPELLRPYYDWDRAKELLERYTR